jgi:hypothetical protein
MIISNAMCAAKKSLNKISNAMCVNNFTQAKITLKRYQLIHKDGSNEHFECDVCGKNALKRHQRKYKHGGESEKPKTLESA